MTTRPSYKSAFLRLFVAVTGLLASVLDLLAGAVRLVVSAVRWVAASLERDARRMAPKVQGRVLEAAPAVQAPASAPVDEEKLRGALVGLGYQLGRVRAFTASCRGRTEGLDVLVKEGIRKLSAN